MNDLHIVTIKFYDKLKIVAAEKFNLSSIPKEGQEIVYENYRYKVTKVTTKLLKPRLFEDRIESIIIDADYIDRYIERKKK